jgi:putative hemolysin
MQLGVALFPLAILLLISLHLLLKIASHLMTHQGRRILLSKWQRAIRWEFWPPYVFYPPLAVIVIWIALRRGRPLACTAVNPAIPHGGITGESKSMILDHLLPSGAVIPFLKLPDGDAPEKIAAAHAWHTGFPLVIKPDVGERGKDVVIVKTREELEAEIRRRDAPTLIQRYAEGAEFGVFYIRHPEQERGRIFSITTKIMTSVTGDGVKTLAELILDDDRAFLSQKHFRAIHAERLSWIPENGETVPLAKLGSHCRGALFLDGGHLITPQLEAEIHRIASTFRGFHFGRFDLRCRDEEALKRGEGIRIIELNGLTSEATHIYHPHTPLLTAYKTLVSQWTQAIEIGNHNAENGANVSKSSEILDLIVRHFRPEKRMTSTLAPPCYRLRTTRNAADIRSAQRLRYAVFNVELGEGLASSDDNGLDADPFDAQCDHLIIEERETGEVVGTYRLQTGTMAAAGLGYYSATEFDFTPYEPLRHEILELGRACIRADHRNRAVLDLLWSGIARYAQNCGARYLLGCSSLTSQCPAEGWGLYEQLTGKFLAPSHLRTRPIGQYIMPRPAVPSETAKTPKLFAAYLAVGAWIAGPPALDADFKTIDFLTILDLENMTRAGKRHFFKTD